MIVIGISLMFLGCGRTVEGQKKVSDYCMTLEEKLLYLADYIDMSRSFPDCVRLRGIFFDADPENMEYSERLVHLDKTLLVSFDMTVRGLLAENTPISEDSIKARNEIAVRLLKKS